MTRIRNLKTGSILNWCEGIRAGLCYSRLAYAHAVPATLHRWFHDDKTSTTALLVRLPDYDVLAWKGTAELKDAVIDFRAFPPKPYAGGWCHPGFRSAHKSLWKQILEHLDPSKPLLVTGHSLGAALAELSAACTEGFADVSMVTFGKPNVWAKWTKRNMDWLSLQLSVVSGSDIVAKVPRIFYHPDPAQDMLYFANNGMDVVNPTKVFRMFDFEVTDVIEDHSLDMYDMRAYNYIAENCK